MYTLHLRRAYGQICGVARDNSAKHALKRFQGGVVVPKLTYILQARYIFSHHLSNSECVVLNPMPSGLGVRRVVVLKQIVC